MSLLIDNQSYGREIDYIAALITGKQGIENDLNQILLQTGNYVKIDETRLVNLNGGFVTQSDSTINNELIFTSPNNAGIIDIDHIIGINENLEINFESSTGNFLGPWNFFSITSAPSFPLMIDGNPVLTGLVIRPTDTGAFYPSSNTQKYITSGDVLNISGVLSNRIQNTGIYLLGLVNNISGGGANLTNVVFTTGNQFISGNKTFFIEDIGFTIKNDESIIFQIESDSFTYLNWPEGTSFISTEDRKIYNDNQTASINLGAGISDFIGNWTKNGNNILDSSTYLLSGIDGNLSLDWNNRKLSNAGGATLDWANYQLNYLGVTVLDWFGKQLLDNWAATGNFTIQQKLNSNNITSNNNLNLISNNTKTGIILSGNNINIYGNTSGIRPGTTSLTVPVSIPTYGGTTKLCGDPVGFIDVFISGVIRKIAYY